jgi:hypothetical protein
MNAVLPRNFLNDAQLYEESEEECEGNGPGVERDAALAACGGIG